MATPPPCQPVKACSCHRSSCFSGVSAVMDGSLNLLSAAAVSTVTLHADAPQRSRWSKACRIRAAPRRTSGPSTIGGWVQPGPHLVLGSAGSLRTFCLMLMRLKQAWRVWNVWNIRFQADKPSADLEKISLWQEKRTAGEGRLMGVIGLPCCSFVGSFVQFCRRPSGPRWRWSRRQPAQIGANAWSASCHPQLASEWNRHRRSIWLNIPSITRSHGTRGSAHPHL